MIKKIGVLGNSHLAAFKLGWEVVKADYPGVEMIFFGSPTTSMHALQVEGNSLVATNDLVRENLLWTSGGYDHIPGGMDAYIVVGMGFSFIHLMALLRSHRVVQIYDPLNEKQQLISESFFEAAMLSTLKNCVALEVIEKISNISSATLFYAPNPFGSINLLSDPDYDYYMSEQVRNYVFDFYRHSLENMFDERCMVVEQPVNTIISHMFTKDEYSRGSIKLKKGLKSLHNSNDYFHLNAEFGALSIRDILGQFLKM